MRPHNPLRLSAELLWLWLFVLGGVCGCCGGGGDAWSDDGVVDSAVLLWLVACKDLCRKGDTLPVPSVAHAVAAGVSDVSEPGTHDRRPSESRCATAVLLWSEQDSCLVAFCHQ